MTFLATWGCASDFYKMLPKFKIASSISCSSDVFLKKKRARYYLVGNRTCCKFYARAKLIFLREQPDDCFFCGEPC